MPLFYHFGVLRHVHNPASLYHLSFLRFWLKQFDTTGPIIGLGTWQTLKLVISSGFAFLIALLIWAAMVIGLRTLILSLLGD